MQIALISDIHGNLFALDAILTDISHRTIKHILCLGDVASGGPQPCEVIQRLRAIGCPVVMGNTDAGLLQAQLHTQASPAASLQLSLFQQYGQEIEAWNACQLSEDDKAFLRAFPPTFAWPLNATITLLGYHGSPRSFREKILPTTPDELLAEAIADTDALILAGGHTHIQMFRRYKEKLLINPGSVGLAMDRTTPLDEVRNTPWGEYAILTCDEKNMSSVELCRVPFDIEGFFAATLQSGMPHADWIVSGWNRR